jgi:hypothetical protein
VSIAAELLQRHIETLVDDHQEWQGLIADNIVWELAYAPAIGHPAKLSGRDEVLHALQLRPHPQDTPRDPGHGGWGGGSRVVAGGDRGACRVIARVPGRA